MEEIDRLLVEQYLNPENKVFTPKLIAKYMTSLIVYIFFKILGLIAVISGLIIVFSEIIFNLKKGYFPVMIIVGFLIFVAGIILIIISKAGASPSRMELACVNKHFSKAYGKTVRNVGVGVAAGIASSATNNRSINYAADIYEAISGYEIRQETIYGAVEELNKAGIVTPTNRGQFLSGTYMAATLLKFTAFIVLIIFGILTIMSIVSTKTTFYTAAICFGIAGIVSTIDLLIYAIFLIICRKKLKKTLSI